MIRTETAIQHIPFPKAGWLGQRLRAVVVSRIKRTKPGAELKARLSEKYKVTEKKKP